MSKNTRFRRNKKSFLLIRFLNDESSSMFICFIKISLQCHESLAPARLCSRHDLRNFVTKDEMKLNGNSSKETLSEDSKNLHKIVENSCTPLRLMSNGMIPLSEQRKNEEIYNFGLELRSIYPKKWSGSNHGIGEKFGETTLNINHTFENIFAAKSEFRLF